MITEGEFDVLIVRQVGNDLLSVASIGNAANKRINPRWFVKFISATSILLRMDEDQAGHVAVVQISRLSLAVKCVQVPQDKDINDFYLHTKREDVRGWVMDFWGDNLNDENS